MPPCSVFAGDSRYPIPLAEIQILTHTLAEAEHLATAGEAKLGEALLANGCAEAEAEAAEDDSPTPWRADLVARWRKALEGYRRRHPQSQ